MGEFIAIAALIVAAAIIVVKLRAAVKGRNVTGCCEDCSGCSLSAPLSASIDEEENPTGHETKGSR
ncbi:MAG: hypothetical protein LBU48_01145 [Coriobacteriales bacterium]|nr:hypothetical protein [Coriobacteriales bacterium]